MESRLKQPRGGPTASAAGTSSFGMSGVNCHAIISGPAAPSSASSSAAEKQLTWQRQRLWGTPPAHPLLSQALLPAASNGVVELVCKLDRPGLAFLWDHR